MSTMLARDEPEAAIFLEMVSIVWYESRQAWLSYESVKLYLDATIVHLVGIQEL